MRNVWIFLMLLGCYAPGIGQNGVHFQNGTFEEALARARKQDKMLFVHVYAEWAQPSEGMREMIFPDERAGKFFNEQFVNWEFDIDQSNEGYWFRGVRIFSIPEYLFFNSEEELMYRESGFLDVDEILEMGKKAQLPEHQIPAIIEKFEEGERDPEFLLNYILTMDGLGKDVSEEGNKYLAKLQPDDFLETPNWRILMACLKDIESREFGILLENRNMYIREHGEEVVIQLIMQVYSQALQQAVETNSEEKLARLKPVIDALVANPVERKSTWLQEKMSFYMGTEQWGKYFEVADELFSKYDQSEWETYNDAAWNVLLSSDEKIRLEKALSWVKKSIELNANQANMDTRARIEVKLGLNEEAENTIREALELEELSLEIKAGLEELLEKLNNGE